MRWMSLFATIALTTISSSTIAAIQTVNITGSFIDGGTYSGSYDLDTTAGNITDWSVDTYLPDHTLFESFDANTNYNIAIYEITPDDPAVMFWNRSTIAPDVGPLADLEFQFNNAGQATGGIEIQGSGWMTPGSNGNYADFEEDFSRTVVSQGVIEVGNGGAPEPATWAMLLVGVGGVGGMLRRNRHIALRV